MAKPLHKWTNLVEYSVSLSFEQAVVWVRGEALEKIEQEGGLETLAKDLANFMSLWAALMEGHVL